MCVSWGLVWGCFCVYSLRFRRYQVCYWRLSKKTILVSEGGSNLVRLWDKERERGRELAEASEWKIHTAAGPKSPSVFARSPLLQTAGQGWCCCANEMVGTHIHTQDAQERIASDAVLSRKHKWVELESAAWHYPSATTGCSWQLPDGPPKSFFSGNQPTFGLVLWSETECTRILFFSSITICMWWSWNFCCIYISLSNTHPIEKKCRKEIWCKLG